MKRLLPLAALLMILFQSCAVVGGIFKAGAFVGVAAVVVVLVIVVWVISRFRRQ